MRTHTPLSDQPIRYKLFFCYFGGFVLEIAIGGLVIYTFMRKTFATNIENKLKISTTTILNMVKTSATVSVKNYLGAIVEKIWTVN